MASRKQTARNRSRSLDELREFARNLRVARGYANMTQEELAGEIKVAVEVYRRYEMGQHWPSLPTLCRLGTALGCRLDALLGFTELRRTSVTRNNDPAALRRLSRGLHHASSETLHVVDWLLDELVGDDEAP